MSRRWDFFLKEHAQFSRAGYHLIYRGTQIYDPARPLYDYIAIKIAPVNL